MQEQVKYNSDGERLRCVGNGLWIPDGYELTQKDELEEEVIRPRIPVVKTMLSIAVSIGTNLTLALFLNKHLTSISMLALFSILILSCVFLNTESIMIFAVLIYQRVAPKEIRNRCLFVPSCSSYSILALGKYGVIIGSIKTIDRLIRCRQPNGGEDYP